MNRSALYVPSPCPDELLFSLLARFTRHLGMDSPKQVLQQLFGDRKLIATVDLPGRLSRLGWLFVDRMGISLDEAALRFTLLPYYFALRGKAEQEAALREICADRPHSLHTRLGINAGRVPVPRYLRQCSECISEDLEKYGETYWRRSHQLPGVLLCPQHGTVLLESDVPTRPRGRHEFVPAIAPRTSGKAAATLPARMRERLSAIAHHSVKLLIGERKRPDQDVRWELSRRLQAVGYGRTRGALSRLVGDFTDFFGEDLLQVLHPNAAESYPLGWLKRLHHRTCRAVHPLRYVLVDLFLSHHSVRPNAQPFGPGPWPCKNKLSSHFGECVIDTVETFRDRRRPELILGRFKCSCGFSYSQAAGASLDSPPRDVLAFGPAYVEQALAMHEMGMKTGRIARLLEIDWKTADRLLKSRERPSQGRRCHGRIEADQAQWLRLIASQPDVGVKALRQQEPALYMRLYRHDRDWLAMHTPEQASRKGVVGRVDWAVRDAAVLVVVRREIQAVRRLDPPERITVNRVATRLGLRPLFQKHLKKMPQVKRLLDEQAENPEDFRIRRLRWAFCKLGREAPKWQLLRKAGIRKAYLSPAIEAEYSRLRTGGGST